MSTGPARGIRQASRNSTRRKYAPTTTVNQARATAYTGPAPGRAARDPGGGPGSAMPDILAPRAHRHIRVNGRSGGASALPRRPRAGALAACEVGFSPARAGRLRSAERAAPTPSRNCPTSFDLFRADVRTPATTKEVVMSAAIRRTLPARADLEQHRKLAKELLADHRRGAADARERIRAALPDKENIGLAEAQFTLAREYGFESWAALKHEIEKRAVERLGPAERAMEAVRRRRAGAAAAAAGARGAARRDQRADLLVQLTRARRHLGTLQHRDGGRAARVRGRSERSQPMVGGRLPRAARGSARRGRAAPRRGRGARRVRGGSPRPSGSPRAHAGGGSGARPRARRRRTDAAPFRPLPARRGPP